MSTIVVGVDGSHGAARALRFAIEEARRSGRRVRALNAWSFSLGTVDGLGFGFVEGLLPEDIEAEMETRRAGALHVVEQAVRAARAELGADDVEIDCEAVQGPAADALVAAARDADLLVVGSRGHGGFAGLLLGSVSQECARHSPCPTVIVPAGAEAPEHERAAAATEAGAARRREGGS